MCTQIHTERFLYLHVSKPPATPGLSEHCHAPVLQRQPPHCAATHGIEATRGPVSRANSSFSRVRSRKRREKRAVGHSLRHTVLPLASVVLPASLNVLLEALREQQQLRGNCFASQIGLGAAGDTKNAHRAQSPPQPIALASLARPTTLNMQLGALRDQQQLRENCFLKNVRAQEALESCRPTKTAQTAKGERPKSSPRV